jgi:hypothetical protein
MKRITVSWTETNYYRQEFDVPDDFDPAASDDAATIAVLSDAMNNDRIDDPVRDETVITATDPVTVAGVCATCGATLDDFGTDVGLSTFCDGGGAHALAEAR